MATVAERAKELGDALDECVTAFASGIPGGFLHERADELIEQALLAERRLALMEAAGIVERECVGNSTEPDRAYNTALARACYSLKRAAAEKEG